MSDDAPILAGWATRPLAPRTGDENNPRDRAAVVAAAARELAQAAAGLAVEVERQQQREADAHARLEDVHRLLWLMLANRTPGDLEAFHAWVECSPNPEEDALGAWDAARRAAAIALATVLGYAEADLSPASVQLELQKRGLA